MGTRVFSFDRIANLGSVAPLWVIIPHFDCREHFPKQRLITAEKLQDLYAAKQLSRGTLIAGLTLATRPLLDQLMQLPPQFLRPLEYVLELIEAGEQLYRPVNPVDLRSGLPEPTWCLPLHMQLGQHAEASGAAAGGLTPSTTGSSSSERSPALATTASTTATAGLDVDNVAAQALSVAPFWCLVHRFSMDQAKCDFNWSSKDLLSGLVSRTVSPYTLVIGIDQHKDRNLPWIRLSLFVPLAAILHQHQHGIRYFAVTRSHVTLFNNLGMKGALAAEPGGRDARLPSRSESPGLGPGTEAAVADAKANATQLLPAAAPADPGPQMAQPSAAPASAPVAAAAAAGDQQQQQPRGMLLQCDKAVDSLYTGPGASMTAEHLAAQLTEMLQLPQQQPYPQLLQAQEGLQGFDMMPRFVAPADQQYDTALFKLFMTTAAGTAGGRHCALWWVITDPRPLQIQGPFTSEQMIIVYVQQGLSDSAMVCGTVGYPHPPAVQLFQALGPLLAAMQMGGIYQLVFGGY